VGIRVQSLQSGTVFETYQSSILKNNHQSTKIYGYHKRANTSEATDHVEGIPAPIDWTSDEDLMEVVFISDAVARVAQRQPPLLMPYADQLTEIVTSDRNYPKYHLFTLGMIGSVDPDVVPIKEIQSRLCCLLSTSTNGYAGWSADTLRRIGDPSVLPELRKHAPEDRSEARDEAELEAFEDTIEELETATQD